MGLKPTGGKVFVILEDALQQSITTKSGAKIYIASWLKKEEWATCEGVVHSVGGRNNLGIRSGEKVAIDYRLISDYEIVDDQVRYNRVLHHEGEVVWGAEDWMIMAVWRGKKWQALGDWCIMEEVEETTVASRLILLTELSKVKKKGCGRLVSGSDAPEGSIVYFPEKFRSLYTFPDGKTYIIISKEYIHAYGQENV